MNPRTIPAYSSVNPRCPFTLFIRWVCATDVLNLSPCSGVGKPKKDTLFWSYHFFIALYCIVLYCIALYCIVLYCIVLYCIVLYCIVSYCIVLYCIVLYCIVLYCIVLYCIVLYCIVLYCIVLYCIVLYWRQRSCLCFTYHSPLGLSCLCKRVLNFLLLLSV